MRHQRVDLLRHAHALFDGASHAHETDAVLNFHQLAHRANATVTEMIDVVDRALAVLQIDEVLHRLKDVFATERRLGETRALIFREILVELVVQLHATDRREVVALGIEEQVEEGLRRLERGRIARPEASVDLHDGVFRRLHLIRDERVPEVRANVQAVDEEDLNWPDVGFAERLHRFPHFLLRRRELHRSPCR